MVLGASEVSRRGGAILGGGADDGTARVEAEQRVGHPGRVMRVGAQAHARAARGRGAVLCSVLVRAWERREEERRKKGEGKKKRRKRKREKEKVEKEKKKRRRRRDSWRRS